MADYTYTQLDPNAQRQQINARIRDLESQYLARSLRITAPGPGEVPTDEDRATLAAVKASLDALHADLEAVGTPAPTA
jgi:hypothetical protein